MQCTKCGKDLPDTVSFCFSCGSPVTGGAAETSMTSYAAPEASAAQAPIDHANQESARPEEAGFVFQEFSGGPSLPQQGEPLRMAPGFVPFVSTPGFPGGGPGFAPPGTVPGYPADVSSPFALSNQGLYLPPPVAAAPARKRRGRSVGCIVLYAFLAIVLLFTALTVGVYEIGSHVLGKANARYQAEEAAAMQLYQQVTSKTPTLQDSLTGNGSSLDNWSFYDYPSYGCALDSQGLRAHISASGRFVYCTSTIATTFKNVAFQIQMQIDHGDAGGLVFRVSSSADGSTASLYIFQITPAGAYSLYLNKDTKKALFSSLATGTTQAMNTQHGAANTLMLIAEGQVFDLYVNQQFVIQLRDATLATGTVGMLADDRTNAADILYSNAKIWDLD